MRAGKDDMAISFIKREKHKRLDIRRLQENDLGRLSFDNSHFWPIRKTHWSGCSKRTSSEAAGESKPEAYPQGYVEDFDEPRTKLATFFSSLLSSGSGRLPIHDPHSGQDQHNAEDFARAHWFFQQHRGKDDSGYGS